MTPQNRTLSSLFAVLFLVTSSAWAAETRLASYLARVEPTPPPALACTDLPGELVKAAQERGVPINKEQIVTTTAEKLTFAGTSVAGFEQIPAPQFSKGVDVGFVFLDAPELGIPAGHYKLNARANDKDIRVGTYAGTVGFVGKDGQEVARVGASFETSTLTVPKPLPFERTQVEARAQVDVQQGALLRRYIVIVIICPNGTVIVIVLGRG